MVLALEAFGLFLLGSAAWLAGERRLRCERAPVRGDASPVACVAEVRRALWLVTASRRRIDDVRVVEATPPALGSNAHWLRVVSETDAVRVLDGSAERTREDVQRLRALLDDPSASGPVLVRRYDWPLALAVGAFGALWMVVISLIMREFLGFHTPWWWRVVGRGDR